MGIFELFDSCDINLDQITFVYELDPYSLEIYRMSENELPTPIFFESYRLTDRYTNRSEIMYHAASRVVNKSCEING